MPRRALTIFVVMLGFLGIYAHAGAQAHPTECREFTDQPAAQVYFDAHGANYENLDTDGNGVACDEADYFASPGGTKCTTFSSDLVAAQAFFVAGGGSIDNNYLNMDFDRNGIACDEPGAFSGGGPSAGPDGGSSAHPTECAEFLDQAAAQTYFDAQGADYENLDANNNGIACDESGTAQPGGSGADEPVVDALPATGSGQPDEPNASVPLMASVSMLLLVGAGVVTRLIEARLP